LSRRRCSVLTLYFRATGNGQLNRSRYLTKEQQLIAAIKDWTGERLIGDDCALLPGGQLVTNDALVQGTHFLIPGISFEDLGWKSLAVNLSDIAAAAGRPRYAVVSLVLPAHIGKAQLRELYAGMVDCGRAFHCRIVGGNLAAGRQIVVSTTVIGDVHENGVMVRTDAHEGDIIIVSGDFGASAAGLWLLQHEQTGFSYCLKRHVRPAPRLCEAWFLVRQTAGRGAMMDASDGLVDALVQIAAASAVGMEIEESKLPIADETLSVARLAKADHLNWALYGGEDYELVAAVNPEDWKAMQSLSGCPFRAIGKVTPGDEVVLRRGDGSRRTLSLEGTFEHWR
jgi:thiamine-monophosphate kinase